MPKAPRHGYYAVRVGRAPGIYSSWAECEQQVKGFNGAVYKKLSTDAEAREFIVAKLSSPRTRDIAPTHATIPPDPRAPSAHTTAKDANDHDTVYCDGACKGNGQPGSVAGIGVWWGHDDPRNIFERCPGDQTNNRAELIAIVRVLETTPHLKRPLVIKTDSNYSIQCLTVWTSNWLKNGFLTADRKPVKNRALIKYLAVLLRARRKTSQTIYFKHVRGHAGVEGNEAADRLANLGATEPSLPERDWENLENQILQIVKSVKPTSVVHDLKACATGPLNGHELARLADASTSDIALPQPGPSRLASERIHTYTSVSPVHASPRVNAASAVPSEGKFTPSADSYGHGVVATRLQLSPSKIPTTSISREELEVLASCLLDDDELATLGKDGVFDSDF